MMELLAAAPAPSILSRRPGLLCGFCIRGPVRQATRSLAGCPLKPGSSRPLRIQRRFQLGMPRHSCVDLAHDAGQSSLCLKGELAQLARADVSQVRGVPDARTLRLPLARILLAQLTYPAPNELAED